MSKHYYPAVFTPEDEGFSVTVPDLPGCFTQGDDMDEAVNMAKEAIGIFIEGLKEGEYSKASNPKDIQLEESQFIVMVEFDKAAYAN